jgi:hypothetical protein
VVAQAARWLEFSTIRQSSLSAGPRVAYDFGELLKGIITFLTRVAAVSLCACLAHAADFVIKGDTVFDRNTGLTWKRCSVGMRWEADQNRCEGLKDVRRFDKAQEIKAEDGWRVPTKSELLTLVEWNDAYGLRIDNKAFPDAGDESKVYWSSTPGTSSSNVWGVDFYDGSARDYSRSAALPPIGAVRLVRGKQ